MKSSICIITISLSILFLASCKEQPGKKDTPAAVSANPEIDSLQTVLNLLQTDSLNPVLWKKQYELFLEKKDTIKALLFPPAI